MPAAALFDVDGTLLDTSYLHTLAWSEALAQFGLTPPMSRVHGAIGMAGTELLEHVLGPGRDRDLDSDISAAHQALYARFWPGLRAFDRAGELLREVAARGRRVVLASSASGRDLEAMRRVLDAEDVLWAATNADDVETSKPAPDLVHAALERSEAGPGEALFVGDTRWDVQAAAAAGVPCIGVTCGGIGECDLRAAGALEVHADPAALLAALDDSALGRA
ncbi:HAD family hydrolase [Kitasatospora sp. NPDC051914]|uniref:HAD family hydrolase n=1 Tax=Kitasatospora sp. NPDC051914 TaxID=3154945 RepID=UPI003423AADD